MCLPSNEGDSYDNREAGRDTLFTGLLSGGKKLVGYLGNRKKISRANQLTIDQHKDDIYKQNTKFNNDWIAFRSEQQDLEAEADQKHVAANKAIAKNQLATWNAIADADNQAIASYAKMMSIGHGEQTGRRSGGSAREAVLLHGVKMAQLGAKLSGQTAELAMDSELKLDQKNRSLYNADIRQAMDQPIKGTKPSLHASEMIEQESPWNLALGLGETFLEARKTYRGLKSKEVKDDSNTFDVGTT